MKYATGDNEGSSGFGMALGWMRTGKAVKRRAWKNTYLMLHFPPGAPAGITMTVDDMRKVWVPDQEALLADDWISL